MFYFFADIFSNIPVKIDKLTIYCSYGVFSRLFDQMNDVRETIVHVDLDKLQVMYEYNYSIANILDFYLKSKFIINKTVIRNYYTVFLTY